MNEQRIYSSWGATDALIDARLNDLEGLPVNELRAKCLQLANVNPEASAARYWDNEMTTGMRRMTYIAAGIFIPESPFFTDSGKPMPHGVAFVNRPFLTIPKNEQTRLLQAIDRGADMFVGVRGGLNA